MQVSPKCWWLSTKLHGVTSGKTVILIPTAVRIYCLKIINLVRAHIFLSVLGSIPIDTSVRLIHIAEAWAQSQVRLCGICGGRSGTGVALALSCSYHVMSSGDGTHEARSTEGLGPTRLLQSEICSLHLADYCLMR
jgi:hypothetical protein